jgi:type II secretory pathway component GspD/PulD (secretin)
MLRRKTPLHLTGIVLLLALTVGIHVNSFSQTFSQHPGTGKNYSSSYKKTASSKKPLPASITGTPKTSTQTFASIPIKGQIAISREVNIAKAQNKITLQVRDADLRDVLNMISKQGNFNLVLDESVKGTLTVDIDQVSINKALEYVFTIADLSYARDGNTLMVASNDAAKKKSLNTQVFRAIPVRHKDATFIAQQLNQTLFSIPRSGGSSTAIAAADSDSNSLLVMGSDADIRMATQALKELDTIRNKKVYQIKYNTPQYVAQVLAAYFTPSGGGLNGGGANGGGGAGTTGGAAAGGAGGGAGATGGAAAGGANAGGAGGAAAGGGNSGGAGGSGAAAGGANAGGGAAGGANAGGMQNGVTPLNAGGITFIAEPLSSTLTVLATDDQLAEVDSMIDNADVRRPQVSIEVALVELNNTDTKRHEPTFGNLNAGQFSFSLIPNTNSPFNTFSWNKNAPNNTNFLESFSFINQLIEQKGKILANPNIVALDNTQSQIQITEQVATFSTSQNIGQSGVATLTTQVTTQDVGIELTITPHITNDGAVTLSVQPQVTQIVSIVSGGEAPAIVEVPLIARRNMTINSVRVQDGQTLVVGGLLQETNIENWRKVPGLSRMPLVGAMFRASNGLTGIRKQRSELVLMLTPHILTDNATTYSKNMANINSFQTSNNNMSPIGSYGSNTSRANTNSIHNGFQPVGLNKPIPLQPNPLQEASSNTEAVPATAPSSESTSLNWKEKTRERTMNMTHLVKKLYQNGPK